MGSSFTQTSPMGDILESIPAVLSSEKNKEDEEDNNLVKALSFWILRD